MLITGKEFNKKGRFGHVHTYGNMYNLLNLEIHRVQNPYSKEKVLALQKLSDEEFPINYHNPCKPIPNTGFWFAPFDFNTMSGPWLTHVKEETAQSMGVSVSDLDQKRLKSILHDSLYQLQLGKDVRVLYINSKKTIKNMFREPDNSYYIDWEKLAEDYDVVYFTSIATDFLEQLQGYKGFEMEQGVILNQCEMILHPVLSPCNTLPNDTPRGLFKNSILLEHYAFLNDIHLLKDLPEDALIMVVSDYHDLGEVFDFTTGKFYYRGQDYVFIPYSVFRILLRTQQDFNFPTKYLLGSDDIEFIKL